MSIVAPRESPFKPLSKTYPDLVSNGDGSISVDDTVRREDLRQKFYQQGGVCCANASVPVCVS